MAMLPQGWSAQIDICGTMDGDPNWSWEHAANPENQRFILWLVTKGSALLQAGSNSYELRPGDCIISPMQEAHSGQHGTRSRLTVSWVVFGYANSRGRRARPTVPPARYRALEDPSLLERLMQRMLTAYTNQRDTWQSNQWLNLCLIEIANQDAEPTRVGLQREQFNRITEVCAAVRAEPTRRWRVDELAELAGYATSHFLRVFRRFIGVPPNEFVIAVRVGEARRLLRSTGLTISEIAAQLGYTDSFYFTKQFTKRVGISPRRYRQT